MKVEGIHGDEAGKIEGGEGGEGGEAGKCWKLMKQERGIVKEEKNGRCIGQQNSARPARRESGRRLTARVKGRRHNTIVLELVVIVADGSGAPRGR
jgi:hypothetical protein